MALTDRDKKTITNMIDRKKKELEKFDVRFKIQQSHREGINAEIERLTGLLDDKPGK